MVRRPQTGAEVTRLAFARAPDTFDVQEDGTVAVAERVAADAQKLGWVRAGETGLHTLVPSTARLGLALAGDRLAYMRPTAAGAVELVVQRLDGPFVPASFPIATPTGFDVRRRAGRVRSRRSASTPRLADGVPAGGATPAGRVPAREGARAAAGGADRADEAQAAPCGSGSRARWPATTAAAAGSCSPTRSATGGRRGSSSATSGCPAGPSGGVKLRLAARRSARCASGAATASAIAVRTADEAGRVALAGAAARIATPKRRAR